jgi:hypothetical protein
MSIRVEVQKIIAIERAKLEARDATVATREDRKKAIFQSVRAVIEQILSVAPEFANATFHSTNARIKVGCNLAKPEISWSVDVDFERECLPIFIPDSATSIVSSRHRAFIRSIAMR